MNQKKFIVWVRRTISSFLKVFWLCLAANICSIGSVNAASVTEDLWHITPEAGFAYFDFSDLNGADFGKATGSLLGIGFTRTKDAWSYGFRYSDISGVTINPFQLSDGSLGTYKIEFQRWQILFGFWKESFKAHLILGNEITSWKGAPGLGVKSSTFHVGAEFIYTIYNPIASKGELQYTIPMTFQILNLPARKYEFQNFPNDTVTAKSGLGYALTVGVDFAI